MTRHFLPLHPGTSEALPTPSTVRQRLGGSGQSEPGAGVVVRFVENAGAATLGVVLFRSGDQVDVYLGDGWVRRTSASAVTPLDAAPPEPLSAIAADARVFVGLKNGDRVRYQDGSGKVRSAVLVDKCRYGAIVANDEQRLIGVGFRKLWPLPSPDLT